MDTSLERIREKIVDLEAKLVNLRIAEHELLALEKSAPRKAISTRPEPAPEPEAEAEASSPAAAQQTIGATISDILRQYGALPVVGIAEHAAETRKDISNRSISFALQAMKKRGLVKSANGEWTLLKGRSKRGRA
jgi:hypothetical protein